jgi:curved DNA-binding protein CbpA
MAANYYEILGVRADAPQTEIHDAFVAALEAYRANPDNGAAAKERLAAARVAYDALKKPANRHAYNSGLGLALPPGRKSISDADDDEDALRGTLWRKYRWRTRAIGFILVAGYVLLRFLSDLLG